MEYKLIEVFYTLQKNGANTTLGQGGRQLVIAKAFGVYFGEAIVLKTTPALINGGLKLNSRLCGLV